MTYNWYNLINRAEFLAEDIPSKELEVVLENVGLVDILITNGFGVSILYDDVFLQPSINGQNPFIFDGYAAYLDANDDLWLGIPVDES